MVDTLLKHKPTERMAAVVRVADFWSSDPVSIESEKYVLVVVTEGGSTPNESVARAWINAGAAYVCAWGPQALETEEAFDHASFLPELGAPLPFTLITTNHKGQSLGDALWFAFYNAHPPYNLSSLLQTVVVVVDSSSLEAQCLEWIQQNGE